MPPKIDKVEAEIKKLQKIEGNKSCADCSEKVPGYVDLTHNVFICTKCSGIHREFQYKVKGVSMSKFTEEDWAGLASMGNEKFNQDYLHHLPSRDILPNGSDVNKLKDFIRQKYMDKKWHKDGFGGGNSSGVFVAGHSSSSAPAAATEDSGRINIKFGRTNSATANRRASTGGMEIKIKAAAPSPSSTTNLTDSMDLLSMNSSSSTPAAHANHDPFASSASGNGQSSGSSDFDPFGPSPSASKAPATDSFDAFSSAPAQTTNHNSTSFDPFGSAPAANNNHNNNGSFNAFGSSAPAFPASFPAQTHAAPAHNANSFGNFGSHDPFATTPAAMPFIHVSPPAAGAASTPATPLNASAPAPAAAAPVKNFSAFDDLLGPVNAPAASSNTLNPFDNAGPSSHMPPAPAGPPAAGHGGFAPNAPPANPYAGYGYPPQQPGQAPAGYPGYGYPQQQQQPPPGYPPQQQQQPLAGYPGYPPHMHPQQQQQHLQQQQQFQQYQLYMQQQQQQHQHQQQQQQPHPAAAPAPAPAAPAAVDPFAAMTSNAWTAAAAGPRPGSTSHAHAPAPAPASYGAPPAPYGAPPSYGAPPPAPAAFSPAPAPAPAPEAASVNPFDLF